MLDRRRQRAARPGLRHRGPDRPPVPDPLGDACRTATPPRPRCASSSPPGRSPTPRSSRAPGATSTACTSWPASPSPPATCPPNATKHDGQLWYYEYAEPDPDAVAYFPYNDAPAHRDARLGAGPRPQPRPGLRRPRRLPRLAVRQPGAHRGRQHRQPPAQLDAGDRRAGHRPQPHRPRAERARRQRLQRDDRSVLLPRRPAAVRQRPGAGPRLRDPRALATYL